MTVTATEDHHIGLSKIKLVVTSDSAGAASGSTTYTYTGQLWQFVVVPDSSTTQPTNAFDITLKDADGIDLLNGLGTDLSNAANTVKFKTDGLLSVSSSALTLAVAAAGDAKGFTMYVHIIPMPERG